jgi:hypothetical protein
MAKRNWFIRPALRATIGVAVASASIAAAQPRLAGQDPGPVQRGPVVVRSGGPLAPAEPYEDNTETYPLPCGSVCGFRTVYEYDWGYDHNSVKVIARCPKGLQAIGGGAGGWGNSNYFQMSDNQPYFDPDDPNGWEGVPIGWTATVIKLPHAPEAGVQIGVNVWAICAAIK